MSILLCPVCRARLERDENRFCCRNGHSFDLAASGYLHLLPSSRMHARIPGDNKQMVRARREFLNKGYYQPVSDALNAAVLEYCRKNGPVQLLDAGCGEGYYTNRLADACAAAGLDFSMVGIDISKFAVDSAARGIHSDSAARGIHSDSAARGTHSPESGQGAAPRVQYAVASVFDLPVKDHSCHVVTNLFAPVCIEEYRRVLKRGGILVFAVTSTRHLWQLKERIYDEPYENEKFDHVYEGFEMIDKRKVSTMIDLPCQEDIDHLFTMTPYYYKSSVETSARLHALGTLQTEIDVDIITYRAK